MRHEFRTPMPTSPQGANYDDYVETWDNNAYQVGNRILTAYNSVTGISSKFFGQTYIQGGSGLFFDPGFAWFGYNASIRFYGTGNYIDFTPDTTLKVNGNFTAAGTYLKSKGSSGLEFAAGNPVAFLTVANSSTSTTFLTTSLSNTPVTATVQLTQGTKFGVYELTASTFAGQSYISSSTVFSTGAPSVSFSAAVAKGDIFATSTYTAGGLITDSTLGNLTQVEYGNGTWLVFGESTYGRFFKSTNEGVTWVSVSWTSTPIDQGYNVSRIKYANGKWVVGGYSSSFRLCSSTDTVTWVSASATFQHQAGFEFWNSYWYTAGNDGIFRSTDAITWTTVFSGADPFNNYSQYAGSIIGAGDGSRIIAYNGYQNGYMHSTNGTTWVSASFTAGVWTDTPGRLRWGGKATTTDNVTWVTGNQFLIVQRAGGAVVSTDGLTWTSTYYGLSSMSGQRDSLYVPKNATTGAGGYWIMHSYYSPYFSTDGVTWATHSHPITGVGHWNWGWGYDPTGGSGKNGRVITVSAYSTSFAILYDEPWNLTVSASVAGATSTAATLEGTVTIKA